MARAKAKPLHKSLTVWGAAIWGIAQAIAPAFGPKYSTIVNTVGQAAGALLSAIGVRRAIAENGNGR